MRSGAALPRFEPVTPTNSEGGIVAAIEVRNFDSPDEARPFEGKGEVVLVNVAGKQIGKATFEPGWRWSTNVKPNAGTESCEFPHFLYVVSGRMRVTMDEGGEVELRAGDLAAIPPGHDAEVIGDEPCITVDIGEEDADYATRG